MKWSRIFLYVTAGALIGMVLGGLFGFGAGTIAPDFFRRIIPWEEMEPRGVATFFGATAGVLLGGGLAIFGIVVEIVFTLRKKDQAAQE